MHVEAIEVHMEGEARWQWLSLGGGGSHVTRACKGRTSPPPKDQTPAHVLREKTSPETPTRRLASWQPYSLLLQFCFSFWLTENTSGSEVSQRCACCG